MRMFDAEANVLGIIDEFRVASKAERAHRAKGVLALIKVNHALQILEKFDRDVNWWPPYANELIRELLKALR